MQSLSAYILTAAAVQLIPRQRMSDIAHVAAYLVGPARLEPQLAQGMIIAPRQRRLVRDSP